MSSSSSESPNYYKRAIAVQFGLIGEKRTGRPRRQRAAGSWTTGHFKQTMSV